MSLICLFSCFPADIRLQFTPQPAALALCAKRRKINFSEERILDIQKHYDLILQNAEKEYQLHPPGKYFPDGQNLFLRIQKYKESHLLFLSHPDLEYTNNLAERGLRKFKRKLKQAVTFRCDESVSLLCNCMSIIETHRQQGAKLFDTAISAFD